MFAKKSLGQNFLKSKEALRSLISAGDIQPTDNILEVGPGKGVLTEELVKLAHKVIAIEKDDRLIELLSEKFKQEIEHNKLVILHQDVLEFNPEETSYKIIANIPYYITGTFIQKFLEADFQPTKMVIMVQKEVAQRIVARDGKESILSISVKAYGEPKYIQTVQAKYFSPEPNVDSAIILINNISKSFFSEFSEKTFFEVVKTGFAHKRKMLIGNLKNNQIYKSKNLEELFATLNISPKARAEDITLEDWKNLTLKLQ